MNDHRDRPMRNCPGVVPYITAWGTPVLEEGPTFRLCQSFPVDSEIGDDTEIILPSNIYGCKIGKGCRIGPYVEIQRGVIIGDRVKIASHTFLCALVFVEDEVFIGHGVMTCNDRYPRAAVGGHLKGPADWTCESIIIRRGASIGSGVTILPGVEIGTRAMIGAGSVVTKHVGPYTLVRGNPARDVGPAHDERNHVAAAKL